MSHTITGRAQPHGLAFDASQLANIGIRPGGTAWGVFVDSPGLDELADLSEPGKRHDNQSVHMVLSGVHPDRWLTCFRLQVFLERKRGATNERGSQSVAYGLLDALARCGVNVLDTSKALMGYDAVSIVALCEFPSLRAEALKLIAACDQEACTLAPLRPTKTLSKELEATRRQLQRLREAAFREIGRRLVHHLAVLQARLMLTDEMRYWYDQLPSFAAAMTSPVAATSVPMMLGGYSRGDGSARNGLSAPWFVNRRILDHSENPFYLGPSRQGHQELAEHDADFWRSFAEDRSFSGCEPGVAAEVFEALLTCLGSHEHRCHQATLEGRRPDRQRACESSFWARSMRITTGEELRSHMIKGVLQRAFAFPILVSPLPTLSYARVWALPHRQADGPNHPEAYLREIEFGYDGLLLSPVPFRQERIEAAAGAQSHDGPVHATPRDLMASIYKTVNRWSQLKLDPIPVADAAPKGTLDNFTFRAAVIGALNTTERFVRVRFVRATTEVCWATFVIAFKAEPVIVKDEAGATTWKRDMTRRDVSSQGLLAVFAEVLAERKFRIEDINLRYTRIDSNTEYGTLNLVVQAAANDNPLRDPYTLCDALKAKANALLPNTIMCSSIEVVIGVPESV